MISRSPKAPPRTPPFTAPNPATRQCSTCRRARSELGGYLPARTVPASTFKAPPIEFFKDWLSGSKGRAVSTTTAFVGGILRALLKDPAIGKLIVPIVPDEGRTFGMESVISQVGIYAPEGQKYTPHDSDMLLKYREEKSGQILVRGHYRSRLHGQLHRRRNGLHQLQDPHGALLHVLLDVSVSSALAIWRGPFADSRGKGFLMGGTAGRTTMLGEGLQHQDGHSPVLSGTIPTCITYDPRLRLRDGGRPSGRPPSYV